MYQAPILYERCHKECPECGKTFGYMRRIGIRIPPDVGDLLGFGKGSPPKCFDCCSLLERLRYGEYWCLPRPMDRW